MRLVRCHVENFGKLHDFDMDFSPGLQVILRENGWGKSTLAAFLRIMFFGFRNERRRSDLENERRRYSPWQEGVYGGTIVYIRNGKRYRLERTFGRKDGKNDQCVIYDEETGLAEPPDEESPGERIFSIDAESFQKTVFVGQQDCDTEATPAIHAKIGEVSEDDADMRHYETAQSELKAAADALNPDRKTGAIYKLRERIAGLEAETAQQDRLEGSLQKIREEKEQAKSRRADLAAERARLQKQAGHLLAYQDLAGKRERYRHLLEDAKKAEEAWRRAGADRDRRLEAVFEEGVPSDREMDEVKAACRDIRTEMRESESLRLSGEEAERLQEEEEMFADYLPEEDECSGMIRAWKRRNRLADSLSERKRTLRMLGSDETDLSRGENQYYSDGREERRRERDAPRSRKRRRSLAGPVCMIILGLLLLAGVPFLYIHFADRTMAAAVTGAGLLFLFAGSLIRAVRVHQRRKDEEMDTYGEDAGSAFRRLSEEIERDREEIDEIDDAVSSFLKKVHTEADESEVAEALFQIRGAAREYADLLERQTRYRRKADSRRLQEQEEAVDTFLRRYYPDYPDLPEDADREETFRKLERDRERYEEQKNRLDKLAGEYQESREACRQFEKKVPEAAEELRAGAAPYEAREFPEDAGEADNRRKFDPNVQESTVSDYAGRMHRLDDEMEEADRRCAALEAEERRIAASLDAAAEKWNELRESREKMSRLTDRYEILVSTQKYLREAKAAFTSGYLNKVRRAFDRYYRIFSGIVRDGRTGAGTKSPETEAGGETEGTVRLDANLHARIYEKGMERDVRFLSRGYQDMISLCRRMAMADGMYPDEKPFLVLDDPFVNLDDRRLGYAKRFLKEVSGTFQIVYFTCRENMLS